MKAVFYEIFGEAPRIASLPDPNPVPDGVVIKVEASGLCRSDWHGWQGHDPDIVLPHVPGHELAGTIAAVGAGVRRWRVGDRVTVPFVGGCGHCPECHSGNHQVCESQFQPGFTAWGSFAELVAVDYADTNLVDCRRHSTSSPRRASAVVSSPRSAPSSTRRASCRANGWRCMAAAASGFRRS